MDSAHPLTVWILGAGFSKPLGGPLLDDLLSEEMKDRVDATYPNNDYLPSSRAHVGAPEARAAEMVRHLYWLHGPSAHSAQRGQHLWSDAEAFLDYIDAAAQAGAEAPARHLRRLAEDPDFPLETLRHASRRLVAAACCAFLREPNLNEERWQPYLSWVERLNDA